MTRAVFPLTNSPPPQRHGSRSRRAKARLGSVARAVISFQGLAVWLVAVTMLAAGPLQGLDRALNRPWSRMVLPDLRPFFVHVVDSLADARVAMSVASAVSLIVAWRARSIRPLVVTAAALTSGTALVVAMKLVTARPRPMSGNPSFFHAGLGENATIYPSGHVVNAILIYGVAVYLVTNYERVRRRTGRLLWCGVALITLVAALTSLYLQWHWVTDLLGGLVAGGLVLRATVTLDRTYPSVSDLPVGKVEAPQTRAQSDLFPLGKRARAGSGRSKYVRSRPDGHRR